ncbi:hypothetical protein BJV74DRAFT_302368 [Russula compacta]|nr:hypothetical protein BJV74DRAFT_302368 [Russula compacta]
MSRSQTPTATASASSSNYQAILDSALEAYKKRTKKNLRSHPLFAKIEACDSPETILVTLRQQISRFDQSRDDRWTKWLNPTVNVLYAFSAAIGGGITLVYPPAGVIFTGIGILLSAATAVSTSQDALVDVFERIENFFKRLETYIEVPPTGGMIDIIVKIMVEVLLILGIATKEIKQSRAKKYLNKLIGRTDMEDALMRLNRLTQEEARMAAARNLKATHEVDDKVQAVDSRVQGVDNRVQQVDDKVQDVDDRVQGVEDRVKDVDDKIGAVIDDGEKILTHIGSQNRNQIRRDLQNWLSPPDPSINYNTASDAHHEGTATWFTESTTFTDWKASGSLLWIHGKPGSGKSVLSSSIIQHIKCISDAGSAYVAYFFFDFKDAGKQDVRALLSSLVIQLSHQSNSFCDILFGYHSTHQSGSQQPSDRTLSQCLTDMLWISGQLPIYVIIDALDECPNTSGMPTPRDKVLALVEKLVELGLPNLRLCITSRPEVDIRTSIEPLTSNWLSLHDQSGQKKDINDFVCSVVYSDRNMRRWRDEDKRMVIETLSERADGMFRWVFCQLEVLRQCLPPSVRHILAELPDTLDGTYERILSEIPKSNRVHAHRLLQCITVAVRPLEVKELAEVLAVDFGKAGGIPELKEDLRWEDQEQAVLSACSSLIAVVGDEDFRVVQFSHFSVKEYLTSDRLATSKNVASLIITFASGKHMQSWRKLVSASYFGWTMAPTGGASQAFL